MTKPRLLITDGLYQTGLTELEQSGVFDLDVRAAVEPAELRRIIGGYDGLLIHVQTRVGADDLKAGAPRLKFVGCASAGFDHVDSAVAAQLGVAVRAATGANAHAVGDLALGFIIGLLRRFAECGHKLRSDGWDRKALTGVALCEKTLGVLGVGHTGRATAVRAKACGMTVLGYDPLYPPGTVIEGVDRMVGSSDELFAAVDVVSVHVPLTAHTKYILGAKTLSAMRPGSFVVNTARGGVVDEAVMKQALDAGQIAGYGVDVFETEPLPKGHWLRQHPLVICTPHVGGATPSARSRISERIAREAIEFFRR